MTYKPKTEYWKLRWQHIYAWMPLFFFFFWNWKQANSKSKDTIFKKATYLSQTMRWELFDVIEMPVLRIISTNSDYLVIFLTLNKLKLAFLNEINIYFSMKIHTWSIIGINPMALARKKHPGRTGSCKFGKPQDYRCIEVLHVSSKFTNKIYRTRNRTYKL